MERHNTITLPYRLQCDRRNAKTCRFPFSLRPRDQQQNNFVVRPGPRNKNAFHLAFFRTGDISSLQVDAIVNSTNESMTDSNSVSDRIFERGGSGLKEEIALDVRGKCHKKHVTTQVNIHIAECRTGEVKVTQGHALPARYIIHTVGPKYNVKYQSAAENTLHACYR